MSDEGKNIPFPSSNSTNGPSDTVNLKYKYTLLKDLTDLADYNFYGIIIDASFPIKTKTTEKESHYECVIKLIDNSTVLPITEDNTVTLTIKSTNRECIPYIHNIGDIIRIHRGTYNPKTGRNVYVQNLVGNLFKSSWTLYSGFSNLYVRELVPYGSSHANYTFESQDRQTIESLRSYLRSFLDKDTSLVYPKQVKLSERNAEESDKDLVAFVVKKVEMEDQLTLFLMDETDGCELHTFKYFNFVNEGDVIRVRSFRVLNNNILLMNEFSNILKIPTYSFYYKNFMNKLLAKYKKELPNEISQKIDFFELGNKKEKSVKNVKKEEEKKFISKVKPKLKNQSEMLTFNEISPSETKFVLNVMVIEITPKPIYNFVNALCPNCQNSYFLSQIELDSQNKFKCSKCKTIVQGKLHYNVKLQCRETQNSDTIIPLYLNTYDSQGNNFFGLKALDVFRNNDAFQKLGNAYKEIVDNYVQVLVERYDNGILRIVGEYDYLG